MPNHKSLVIRTVLEPAKRKRQCCHKKEHSILQGEISLVVREGQFKRKVYCKVCALGMLQMSMGRLKVLEESLNKGRD